MQTLEYRITQRIILTALLMLAVVLAQFGPGASVAHAAGFAVTNLDDDGAGSLRQAILEANAAPGPDTITFEVSGAITLVTSLPNIADPDGLTIDGSGQSVTVSGNNAVRVARVNSGAELTVRNLTITDGRYEGIFNDHGTLTVSNSTFYGHDRAILSYGTLTVSNSTFYGNDTGIYNDHGTLTVSNSTFSVPWSL